MLYNFLLTVHTPTEFSTSLSWRDKQETHVYKVHHWFAKTLVIFSIFPSSCFQLQKPPHSQGLLLLLVALLPMLGESAPTIQSLVPAIAFTPVVCPIALARSIIKKVSLSISDYLLFIFSSLPPTWSMSFRIDQLKT